MKTEGCKMSIVAVQGGDDWIPAPTQNQPFSGLNQSESGCRPIGMVFSKTPDNQIKQHIHLSRVGDFLLHNTNTPEQNIKEMRIAPPGYTQAAYYIKGQTYLHGNRPDPATGKYWDE